MNSQARTKRCLHVFIFNFFASLILFSSSSVWALTGKEARHLGQGMISHSANIEGIDKANLDAYRQIKDYETNANLGISAIKHAAAIQTMDGVKLGNINLYEAANALLNYSDSIETFKAMKKGMVVVNEIENQLQDKLKRRKDYSIDLSVYADRQKEATKSKLLDNMTDAMKNSTKGLIRATPAAWKIFRVAVDEDKLVGKKVGAAISVAKAIDNIQTLYSLGSALITVMSQDNPNVEDMAKVLADISDLANKTKTSSGFKLISATTDLNKNIARLKLIKNNHHYLQPDLLKYTLRIAEQTVVEDILSNVGDMLEVFAKTVGLEKEMKAFTSTRKLFRGDLVVIETRLENDISNAKAGLVPVDDGIRAFQAAIIGFETDLGAVIDREPAIKNDVFGVNESYNYEEYSPTSLASLENRIAGQKQKIRNQHRKQKINEKYKQKILVAEHAAKRRQQQRIENIKKKILVAEHAVKRRQEQLLSGNYAFGTIIGGNFSRNSESQSGFIGVDTLPSVDGGTVDRYTFGYARNILPVIRNGNSISIGLSFDNLKESVPSNSSDNASLVSSDRVRARSGDYGDYSYIAWGSWAGGENTRFRNYDRIRGGHWIYGQRLGTVDIPKSGSARYVGQVRGDYVHGGRATVEMNSITGDINMTVTFRDGNNSLSGAMNLDRNGTHWARARFNTQNARSSSGSNIFRTSLKVQDGGRGQLRGSFFGANAAEAGGSFAVNKDGIAVGAFRAKKQ